MHGTEQRMGAPMLTHEQLQRELAYRDLHGGSSKTCATAGLVTGREFVRLSQFLAERFSPCLGRICIKITVDFPAAKEGYMVAEGGEAP